MFMYNKTFTSTNGTNTKWFDDHSLGCYDYNTLFNYILNILVYNIALQQQRRKPTCLFRN